MLAAGGMKSRPRPDDVFPSLADSRYLDADEAENPAETYQQLLNLFEQTGHQIKRR